MVARNVRKTHNKHLQDLEVAAEYMNDAFASGDAANILMAIRNVVDAQEMGISGLAEKTQLGRESMYKMLSSNGNPKFNTFSSVLDGLGLQLHVSPKTTELHLRKS